MTIWPMMTSAAVTLAQVTPAPANPVQGYAIGAAVLLLISVVMASIMSSKRTHRD